LTPPAFDLSAPILIIFHQQTHQIAGVADRMVEPREPCGSAIGLSSSSHILLHRLWRAMGQLQKKRTTPIYY